MSTKADYLRFRKGDFRLSAKNALRMARIINQFAEAENAGLVRLIAEDEQENYFDAFGYPDSERERKAIEESIERYGNYCVAVQVNNGTEYSGDDWRTVDSIGMCAGYKDVLSPFENYYIPDLMDNALAHIDEVETEESEAA